MDTMDTMDTTRTQAASAALGPEPLQAPLAAPPEKWRADAFHSPLFIPRLPGLLLAEEADDLRKSTTFVASASLLS